MILPLPEFSKDISKYPLTITLAALNLFLFVLIFSGIDSGMSSSPLLKSDGLVLTGRLYQQYLGTIPQDLRAEKPAWIADMTAVNEEQMGVLGAYALRDSDFLMKGETFQFKGDQVQISNWRQDFSQFREKYKEQLLYRFGLSSWEKSPLSWITYQFSHSNWMHLFSNLAFLIVIAMAVEAQFGSFALLVVYLFGGIAGGMGFILSDVHGTIPMVGASASISALMAFYCLAETRMRVRFLYFASPMQGHHGAIYLPTLLIIPLFLIVDLASLISTPEGLGSGVAYAAHLGGSLLGGLWGAWYRGKVPSFFASFR